MPKLTHQSPQTMPRPPNPPPNLTPVTTLTSHSPVPNGPNRRNNDH